MICKHSTFLALGVLSPSTPYRSSALICLLECDSRRDRAYFTCLMSSFISSFSVKRSKRDTLLTMVAVWAHHGGGKQCALRTTLPIFHCIIFDVIAVFMVVKFYRHDETTGPKWCLKSSLSLSIYVSENKWIITI